MSKANPKEKNRRTLHSTHSNYANSRTASKLARDYSFMVDDNDELKGQLRRNSLAGQTSRSIDSKYFDRNSKKESKNKSKDIHQELQTIKLNQDDLPESDKWVKTAQRWSMKKYDPLNYDGQTSTTPDKEVTRKPHSGQAGGHRTNDSKMGGSPFNKEDTFTFTPYEKHFLEIEAQDKYIETNGLHRFHIIPDGNCLYRAVAQAVLLDQSQHELLRQRTVEYIADNVKEFRDLIEGDVESFLATAGVEGVWAGYTEVLALTRWLNININITTGGDPANPKVCTACNYYHPRKGDHGRQGHLYKKQDVSKRQTVWLSWLSSGHYDMLSDVEMDNRYYDEWIRSRESNIHTDEEYARKISKSEALKSVNQKHDQFENAEGYDSMNRRYNHGIDDVSALSDSVSHDTNAIMSQEAINESTKYDKEIAMAIEKEMSHTEDDYYYA